MVVPISLESLFAPSPYLPGTWGISTSQMAQPWSTPDSKASKIVRASISNTKSPLSVKLYLGTLNSLESGSSTAAFTRVEVSSERPVPTITFYNVVNRLEGPDRWEQMHYTEKYEQGTESLLRNPIRQEKIGSQRRNRDCEGRKHRLVHRSRHTVLHEFRNWRGRSILGRPWEPCYTGRRLVSGFRHQPKRGDSIRKNGKKGANKHIGSTNSLDSA